MWIPTHQYVDVSDKFGGVTRHFLDGRPSEVITRPFGLTTEPPCSEAAHETMLAWLRARPEFYDPIGLGFDPFAP